MLLHTSLLRHNPPVRTLSAQEGRINSQQLATVLSQGPEGKGLAPRRPSLLGRVLRR